MSFEHLFATSVLNVVVPDTSVEYPPQSPTDDWLARLQSDSAQRKQAFFDEQLQSLLIVRIKNPTPADPVDPDHPPQILLSFIAHIQISLEATYISSVPIPNPDTQRISRLSAPLRTAPLGKSSSRLQPHHPSIFPPNTPNPTPSSADHDRKYVTSEGTLLLASIWGQDTSEDSQEAFSLLWSDEEQSWVAVYRLGLTISFLRLTVSDPLLCLTVSTTLREKPLTITQSKHPLALFFASVGSQSALIAPESPTNSDELHEEAHEDGFDGLEEVNLLEGLFAGPTFSASGGSRVYLPTTRLGTVSRQKLFSLPPVSLPNIATPSPSPMTAVRTAHPTLRKSYRKTLRAVSGFRVRMRTVFVPYVLLPETEGRSLDLEEAEAERERREAGNEERTVVLCVEVENSGESGTGIGFVVEKVEVNIGGDGAKATLIGWGDGCFRKDVEQKTFPLHVGSMAQYNLLYAVSFLRSPEEVEGFSLFRDTGNTEKYPANPNSELQRAVAINIFGKPYLPSKSGSTSDGPFSLSYPTHTFSSRWNCVLDLSAHQGQSLDALEADSEGFANGHHALPEPASPFPVSTTPRTANFASPGGDTYSAGSTPQSSTTAGSKRYTLPGGNTLASRSVRGGTPNRASMPVLNLGSPANREREQPPLPGSSRMSYIPPSVATQPPRSPTTYSTPEPPPPPPPDSTQANGNLSPSPYEQGLPLPPPPMTPAYPAYPPLSALPPTPMSQGPIASHTTANVGPSVEIRRERGVGVGMGMAVPQSPVPWVSGAFGEQKMLARLQSAEESGESIVVSVGLLPLADNARRKKREGDGRGQGEGDGEVVLGPGKIYPLDYFTLDIFVFNQSMWTRRFEITCPDVRRRRERGRTGDGEDGQAYNATGSAAKKMGYPGILPLDSRVRIGPLRPSACQSVRMEFLAVTSGVHSIDALTLNDIESGFSMNLRSVMDIVVHDPND